ncbi:MAG: thioredoxin [Comamonadaceae bacterium]|nr:MAG: thioredoxin [Comamonadaceae bacterium]
MTQAYEPETLQRSEVDQLPGPVVVDFGTNWCGHCQAARPLVDQAFASHAGVKHLKIEDGSGRRLGRSFGVKLWPTLVFLRDGRELARLVRPGDPRAIAEALAAIAGPAAQG